MFSLMSSYRFSITLCPTVFLFTITSAKEVVFSAQFIDLFICLSVGPQQVPSAQFSLKLVAQAKEEPISFWSLSKSQSGHTYYS